MLSNENLKLKESFLKTSPNFIRNVCIIAHVDHGKTTLADYLISTNGIISARLAGKVRYMDSRDDEQTRGITMKSSAISLFYDPVFINLIDSPGHVDFCAEVSSAIKLADVAILVVDVVEGVCSQTESLLREAIVCQLDMVLVVNKLDRLVVELGMTCAEAHRHIQNIIERINGCLSQILQAQFFEEENWKRLEEAESRLQFDPLKGNLLFASAFHGYAFSLSDFSALWSTKLEISKEDLQPFMFSFDHYFHASSKKVQVGAESKGKRCLFEQLVLEPLWQLHKCAFVDGDAERLKQFAMKLGLQEARRRCRADEAFNDYMREWMPLTSAVIRSLCAFGRSPVKMYDANTNDGVERIIRACGTLKNPLCQHVQCCDSTNNVCIIHVAKFFLLGTRKVALCRVICGTLKENTEFVLTDAITRITNNDLSSVLTVRIGGVFIVLGKELLQVEYAPAGQICMVQSDDNQWIGGHSLVSSNFFSHEMAQDDQHVLRKRVDECQLCFETNLQVEPLVRVTIHSASGAFTEQMNELKAALKQLSVMDSAVRLFEQENGDLALVTAGEVHLQKCLKDLHDLGQTDVIVSEPIVPFRETIIPDVQISMAKIITEHETECLLKQYNVKFRIRAIPLPDELLEFLYKNHTCIDRLREGNSDKECLKFRNDLLNLSQSTLPKIKGTWWWKKSEAEIDHLFNRITAFGPRNACLNVLINTVSDYEGPFVWHDSNSSKKIRPLDRAVIGGFQLAVSQGLLCEEPMQGVIIIMEEWHHLSNDENDVTLDIAQCSFDAQLHGQLISAMRQTCKAALKKHSLRLVAAMYKCIVQTSTQALGKVQTVLAQRRAKVISEDVNEISGLFEVIAYMPVIESFSFCEQLRKRTSGMASAHLSFSHWQVIDEDPFWEPTTLDEIEEYGTNKGSVANQARAYMDAIRKRKGIPTDEIIVVNAEKQRNLKRNK